MHRTRKKIISVLITVCLMFTLLIPVNAQGNDISKHWARATFEKWAAEGLLKGYADGTYKPDNTVTKVEFVAFIDRIFKYINISEKKPKDVVSGAWYEEYISRALAAGIIQEDGNGNIQPQKAITRGDAAVILAKAFSLKASNLDSIQKYTDYGSIPYGSCDAIAAMTEKGYINGNPDKTFGFGRLVTRAEAITMLNRAMGTFVNSSGTYDNSITGNLTVNAKDAVIKDITIGGDLYLTQGIGQGDVTLENVKVTGKTYVFGGGENSIKIKDSVLSGTLVLQKKVGKVRIVTQGNTEILNTELYSGAILKEEGLPGKGFSNVTVMQIGAASNEISLSGNYNNIVINDKNTKLKLLTGSAGTLTIPDYASGAELYVDTAFVLDILKTFASLTVSGKGTISTASVWSAGVEFEQAPSTLYLSRGISVIIAGAVRDTGYDITGEANLIPETPDPLTPPTDNSTPTLAGHYYICPNKGIPGDIRSPYVAYESDEKLSKGTVVFTLPKEFKATTSDRIDIGTASSIVTTYLTVEQLSNDGTVVTLKNITTQPDSNKQYINLHLDNKTVPAVGVYKFLVSADADGTLTSKGMSAANNNGEYGAFTSANGPVDDFKAVAKDSSIYFTFSPCKDSAAVMLQMSTDAGITYSNAPGINLTPESSSATVNGLSNGVMYMFRLVAAGGSHNGTTEPITISPTKISTSETFAMIDTALTVNTDGTFDKFSIITIYLRDANGNPISNANESFKMYIYDSNNNINRIMYLNGSDIVGNPYITGFKIYDLYNVRTDSDGNATLKISLKQSGSGSYDTAVVLIDPNNYAFQSFDTQ